MSLRIDTSDYFASTVCIGNVGLGVLAENIPSTGDSGASFLYNDLVFPADTGKEIRGEILATSLGAGTLFVNEDGSFTFSGASDGHYWFTYKLWKDGVAGATYTVTLTVGSIAGTGTGAIPNIALNAPVGVGVGTSGSAGTGVIASIALTSVVGVGLGTISSVGAGAVHSISLSAPSGVGAGTGVVNGSSVGALATISLSAPTGSGTASQPSGQTLSSADIAAIASAVRSILSAELLAIIELNRINGLETGTTVIIDDTNSTRIAGTISQQIQTNSGVTTIVRTS